MTQQYEFTMRACEHDREGYYYPRWDLAQKLTVVAATKQDAINQGAVILGASRSGRYWGFKVDSIRPAATA